MFSFSTTISNYHLYTGIASCPDSIKNLLVLRQFKQDGRTQYLMVDPADLSTSLQPADRWQVQERTLPQLQTEFAKTLYCRALRDADTNDRVRQDAGLTRLFPSRPGIDLTIDLCPSRRPLDSTIFLELMKVFSREAKPIPLSISITGVWMKQHPEGLDWLLKLQQEGEFAVTWINHSFHHRLGKGLPPEEQYLLKPGTDLDSEILGTEKAMLEKGLLPSVFFRFPDRKSVV
jgi:hypothetical protein